MTDAKEVPAPLPRFSARLLAKEIRTRLSAAVSAAGGEAQGIEAWERLVDDSLVAVNFYTPVSPVVAPPAPLERNKLLLVIEDWFTKHDQPFKHHDAAVGYCETCTSLADAILAACSAPSGETERGAHEPARDAMVMALAVLRRDFVVGKRWNMTRERMQAVQTVVEFHDQFGALPSRLSEEVQKERT